MGAISGKSADGKTGFSMKATPERGAPGLEEVRMAVDYTCPAFVWHHCPVLAPVLQKSASRGAI
jgi:hypothetical protein